MTIKSEIQKKMKAGKVYAPKDFEDIANPRVASQTLSRLVGEGKVRKVERGKYQLKRNRQEKQRVLDSATDILLGREQIFNRMGLSFDNRRDSWEALGYKRRLDFQDFLQWYQRGDIAKRLIEAPPKACWKNSPLLVDDNGEDGDFAQAWKRLDREFSMTYNLSRADIKSRIGRFGLIVLGYPGDMANPVRKGSSLRFVMPLLEDCVQESIEFESDPTSPRFGKPNFLNIEFESALNKSGTERKISRRVHHSRFVWIAEDRIIDNLFGTPAMHAVFNKLMDLEKVVGGSAESVWKTFDRGLVFNLDSDAVLNAAEMDTLDEEVQRYMHGLQRFIRAQGIDVKTLGAEAADPRGHFQVLANIISGTTGIPQRILFGSERGQLASTADQDNWNDRVRERQQTYLEPDVLIPIVERLIEFGTLSEPKGMVQIVWPDLDVPTERERIERLKLVSQAARLLSQVRENGDISREELREMIGLPK